MNHEGPDGAENDADESVAKHRDAVVNAMSNTGNLLVFRKQTPPSTSVAQRHSSVYISVYSADLAA